jgi:GNAT superfamily N-acetyltransferase
MSLASRTLGEPPDRLRLVARLFISPTQRRRGIAAALLATASDAAHSLGCVAILDVATKYGAAIRLYETNGWVRLGTVTVDIGTPELLDEFVFARPPAREVGTAKSDELRRA